MTRRASTEVRRKGFLFYRRVWRCIHILSGVHISLTGGPYFSLVLWEFGGLLFRLWIWFVERFLCWRWLGWDLLYRVYLKGDIFLSDEFHGFSRLINQPAVEEALRLASSPSAPVPASFWAAKGFPGQAEEGPTYFGPVYYSISFYLRCAVPIQIHTGAAWLSSAPCRDMYLSLKLCPVLPFICNLITLELTTCCHVLSIITCDRAKKTNEEPKAQLVSETCLCFSIVAIFWFFPQYIQQLFNGSIKCLPDILYHPKDGTIYLSLLFIPKTSSYLIWSLWYGYQHKKIQL